MNVGTVLQLEGVSRKGRNRVRENGALWKVMQIADQVRFTSMPGPWLDVEPSGGEHEKAARHGRWIHATHDADFRIVAEIK